MFPGELQHWVCCSPHAPLVDRGGHGLQTPVHSGWPWACAGADAFPSLVFPTVIFSPRNATFQLVKFVELLLDYIFTSFSPWKASVVYIWGRWRDVLSSLSRGLLFTRCSLNPDGCCAGPHVSSQMPWASVSASLSCCLWILFSPTINICSDLFTAFSCSPHSQESPGRCHCLKGETISQLKVWPRPAEPETQLVTASGCVSWGPHQLNQTCKRPTHKSEKECANLGWA